MYLPLVTRFLYHRVKKAIEQGVYLRRDSAEVEKQGPGFGIADCPSDGWQDQLDDIHMACPVVTVAYILHHMRPATGVSSIQAAAFRSLAEGHTVWKSGHVLEMTLNATQTSRTWMRFKVQATMKQEVRLVVIAFDRHSHEIRLALCSCPAGLAHSCIHVSACLWSLESFGSKLAPTSKPCAWIRPRTKGKPIGPVSSITLQKHKLFKRDEAPSVSITKPVDYDPRPPALRGQGECMMKGLASELINRHNVDNMPLLVSVFIPPPPPPPAPRSDYNPLAASDGFSLAPIDLSDSVGDISHAELCDNEFVSMCSDFKASLQVSDIQQLEIEFQTRGQASNPKWFEARRNRVTASTFADVVKRKPTTVPDPLVKRILGYTKVPTWLPAIKWGQDNEPVARLNYLEVQRRRGHAGIRVVECGLFIDREHGWLGASPDGLIHDPATCGDPDGVLEIKCPFSVRSIKINEAAQTPGFYCQWKDGQLHLKRNHKYYYQVQGQMAITGRNWCDFVVWTECDIFIERIKYRHNFWIEECMPKLANFYDKCVLPEIVAPRYPLGLPMLDLR